MIGRRRRQTYQLGISGLAASARAMMPGRLYAMLAPTTSVSGQATAAENDGMRRIPLACLVATVADALRGGGRSTVVLSSPPEDFLAQLRQREIDVDQALASRRLTVLRQTGHYADLLARHGLQRFLDELDLLGDNQGALVAIERAETLFATEASQASLQAQRYQRWFAQAGATGLLLFQPSADGTAALRALDDCCAGFAAFQTEGLRFVWQVRYWLSPLGSIGQRDYGLGFDAGGAPLIADGFEVESTLTRIQQAPDLGRVIATRTVVEGESGVPADWRIVDDLDALLAAADGAIAATCLIEFSGGDQLRTLAQAVHHLRRRCGRGLRIIIRERQLHLRYNDELLLLRLGANHVVYAEVRFSRFRALIESTHRTAYSGDVPEDFESAVQSALPPGQSGYLRPTTFCEAVLESMALSAHIGVESTLVSLQLETSAAHLDALRACRITRMGDLLTADQQRVWLFLYACREPDAETTLERMFGDALTEMFEGHTLYFAAADIRGAIDVLEKGLYATPIADFSSQLMAPQRATPAAATPTAAAEPPRTPLPAEPSPAELAPSSPPRRATRRPLHLNRESAS